MHNLLRFLKNNFVFGSSEKIINSEKPPVTKFQQLWLEFGYTGQISSPTGKISVCFTEIWPFAPNSEETSRNPATIARFRQRGKKSH